MKTFNFFFVQKQKKKTFNFHRFGHVVGTEKTIQDFQD